MDVTPHHSGFWKAETRECHLYFVDGTLELRLYDAGQLVGLELCDDVRGAYELALKWRENPPLWPPY